MSSSSSTAGKVLDILLLFDESRSALTAEDIGQLIDAPRSSTYRYIRTLCNKGFLQKTASGKYQLGPSLLQFKPLLSGEPGLRKIALPEMDNVMRKTNETVLLTRRFGRHSVCVERVEGSQAIRITFERGHTQPLHAGASSKILLAYTEDEVQDNYLSKSLKRFTENTITDPEQMKVHLDDIRSQGYCISEGEVDMGAIAVAVPIFNQNKEVIAGLSVAGPAFRTDKGKIEAHLRALQTGARVIEEQFQQELL